MIDHCPMHPAYAYHACPMSHATRNSFGTRTDRAQQIFANGGITIDGDTIKVPSASGDRVYTVRLVDGRVTCNCQDYANRQRECKHCVAAALFVAQQAGKSDE